MAVVAVRHPGEFRWETRLLGVVTSILVVFGLAATAGAALTVRRGTEVGSSLALNQLVGAFAGLLIMSIMAGIDYRRWRPYAWPLLLVTIAILFIPILPFTQSIAPTRFGARRWINLPFLSFQPSEVARFAIALWCAMLASKKGLLVREWKRGALPFVIVIGLVAVLILAEKSLSMAVIVALVGGVILFTSGAKIGHFIIVGVVALMVGVQAVLHASFRLARVKAFIDSFVNPEKSASDVGFQLQQSLIGAGSGGFTGRGFGEGTAKLGHLPLAYSDFLFSTIAEEWGFVGVVLVVLAFAAFVWLGLRIAKTAPDPFGMYLAVGVTASVGISALLHMAVSLGLWPTTGITLPFMSFGRSSLLMALAATGILINIGRMRGKPMPKMKTDD